MVTDGRDAVVFRRQHFSADRGRRRHRHDRHHKQGDHVRSGKK